MKALRELYFANLTEFLSNRRALFLTIAFPVLFITIFGLVFTNQDKIDVRIGLANADDGQIGRQIADALESAPKTNLTGAPGFNRNDSDSNPFSGVKFIRGNADDLREELKHGGRLDGVIIIPAGISAAAEAKARVKLMATAAAVSHGKPPGSLDPAAPGADNASAKPAAAPDKTAAVTLIVDPMRQLLGPILQGLINHVLDGVNAGVTGDTRLLDLNTESVQARQIRTVDYLLPGILAMSIMQLGLFATAQPLVALRVQGVLKRLGATPLPRTTLLVAYVALRLTIALLQTAIVVLIGHYAFKVAMVGNWWVFSGWVLLGTLAFIALGFFIAAVSKNEESVIAISNIINLPMILLSGVFFPVDHLPKFLDYPIRMVPLNYLSDALRHTMLDTPPIHDPLTNLIGLSAWVILMTVLAIRFFSWDSR